MTAHALSAAGETLRSTRWALARCIRCGAIGRSIVVLVPVGAAEPIDVSCGWRDARMCPNAQAALPIGGAK